MWKARRQTIRRLRHEEVDEPEPDRVCAAHRSMWADHEAQRSVVAAGGAEESASYFARPSQTGALAAPPTPDAAPRLLLQAGLWCVDGPQDMRCADGSGSWSAAASAGAGMVEPLQLRC